MDGPYYVTYNSWLDRPAKSYSTLDWLFKSCKLDSSSLNTGLVVQVMSIGSSSLNTSLTVQVMLAQFVVTQHCFDCSSDMNHAKLTPNLVMQTCCGPSSTYACSDTTCLVRIVNISESVSQLHAPCTEELQPIPRLVVHETDNQQYNTIINNFV